MVKVLFGCFVFTNYALLVMSLPRIGYFTPSQLHKMSHRECNITTLQRILKRTPRIYNHRAITYAYFPKHDRSGAHEAWVKDAEQSFMQTIAYICTGDTQYAQNAVSILKAWPLKNKHFNGPNALLEAGWGLASMTRAISLLEFVSSPGWSSTDKARYFNWMNTRLSFVWTSRYATSWDGYHSYNNWHATLLDARLAVAFLRNDTIEIDWVQEHFKRVTMHMVSKEGFIPEDDRDFSHIQFTLGGMMQVAEALYNHGIDLFMYPDGRLYRMMEQHAKIANGKLYKGKRGWYSDRHWVLPCGWHIALRHYGARLQLPVFETGAAYGKVFWPYSFHWGLSDV